MESASLRQNLRPYAYVLAGVMLGGLSPVFTKLLLLQDVEGSTIVAARYLLTVIFLLPFGLPQRRTSENLPPPDRRAWITLVLVGAFGSGLGALMFTAAVDMASAGVVNAISKTAPIFVALFSYFALRERVSYMRFLLIAVMVAADVLIIAGEMTFSGQLVSTRLLGDLLALGAGLTRAIAELLGKSALRRFRPTTVALWRFGVGLVVAGTVSFGTGGWPSLIAMSLTGWVILFLLAGVSTALYMSLYYRGLSEIPAHVAVSLKLLGAIVTVMVSWIVLGEALTPYHIAGIAVLISGAYLLVMRSARDAEEERPHPQPWRPWTRLRPRLVGLVVLLVIVSVGFVWYLTMRQSVQLVRQQVQLTVGEIAAILVEFGGLEERPSWQAYQQYLQRVVGHRVEGDLYALEVVYVAALDARGNIGAWAVAPELQITEGDGRHLQVPDRTAMQRLLQVVDEGAASRGLITATAELHSEGRVIGSLKMGCRREMAEGMIGEIVGRSAVVAITVLLLAGAIATLAVGGMLEPIERLTAQLWTRGGSGASEGNLDEVEQIRRALGVVGEAMGLERTAIAGLSLSLAEHALADGARLVRPPAGRAWLAVLLPDDSHPEELAHVAVTTAREAARHGGVFSDLRAASTAAAWGAERDEALRAALAALELADALAGQLADGALIVLGAGHDAERLEEAAGLTLKRTGPAPAIVIGVDALADASEHLATEELDGGMSYRRVIGMREAPDLRRVAREPED
jgi:drug/metabolite transporter (DMT)-like permease